MKQWILSFFLLALSACAGAQAVQEYESLKFETADGLVLPYRRVQPELQKSGKKYPLVLFLHGVGERGSDNMRQLKHCGEAFLNPHYREEYPAFVLFPQCPAKEYWSNPRMTKALRELVEDYLADYPVDKRRVYIVGISMGAIGTYALVSQCPELFAAAVPICGRTDPQQLYKAREVKFRIFHGDADNIVLVSGSREAYRALRAADADVEYVEFVGCGHESWNMAFNYPGFMEWLFAQRRK